MVSTGGWSLREGLGWGCLTVAGSRTALQRPGAAQPTRLQPPSQLCSSLLGPGVPATGCGLGGPEAGLVQGAWCRCPYLRCCGGLAPLSPRVIIWTSPQVGDFAILLRAGFDRWSAAKLQLSTALGGLLGACFAICTQSPKGVGTGMVGGGGRWQSAEGSRPRAPLPTPGIRARLCPRPTWEGVQVHTAPLGCQPVRPSPTAEETVACILPFTSGGFLYIALVNVLPDLLEEDDPW